MLLTDKVVVISGVGPGLGVQLALLAASEGARIAICSRSASKLDDIEYQVAAQQGGVQILKFQADITDRNQCMAFADRVVSTFGRLDVLINNAYDPGVKSPIESADPADWRRAMEVNLFGSLNMTQAAIPHMKKQGGAIVMVNTIAARQPMSEQGGYSVSKSALRAMTAQLASELGQYRIRVNSAFIGWMWGPPCENFMRVEAQRLGTTVAALRAEVAVNIALGDIPADSECAKAVIMLASHYTSAVTGAALDVNGGQYISF
jgi:NAD(P)-dependent dehydrogenase (short-subunit alcohol dehydrogenase family)